jgi:hyperosmotically inducible protein
MRHQKVLAGIAVASIAVLAACVPTRTTKSAGETIDDSVITTKVKAELARDDKTSALHTNVETFRGTVQLNGFASSASEKAEATRVARAVGGVKKVDNNLKVDAAKRSAGEYVDDKVIVSKVKADLIADPGVAGHEVTVDSHDGVVLLGGFVDSAEQKAQAERVATAVGGVKSVDNQLTVKTR